MSAGMPNDTFDAADAFGAIGNEHRVAILRALMIAYQQEKTPVAYSDLMERVQMRDSGRFNYHLQQLVGRFVAEDTDGYALTYAGRTVVAAIASGTLTDSASLDPEPIKGTCYACGESALVLRYPSERVRVTCGACEEEVVHTQFPPGGITERTVTEIKHAFDRWLRSWSTLACTGVCPECSGRMVGELAREVGTPATGNVTVRAVLSCEQCWARGFFPPGLLVIEHPAVAAFYWQRGIDVRKRPLWKYEWALSNENQTVVSEEPLRVQLQIPSTDAVLHVEVGNSLSVESVSEHRDL